MRASRFDALTGLYNRSFFFTTMEQEMRRSDRMGRGFTMLMLDLDDLKPVNDTFGHQWGDRLLKGVADTIRRTIRFTDAAARYGGDEFVVLLPETDVAGGYVVAEKLRRDIYALTLFAADRNVRSSASVGLVNYPDDGSTIEQLVAAADVAMYEAKRRGKNRIVGYQTGTGRVATDIDGGSGELVQLTPADDVRTGGDPVPWGAFTPEGHAGAIEDELTAEVPQRSAGGRQRGSATIPVEPDEEAPVPWAAEPAMPRRSPGPRPAPDSRIVEEPPEPPSRARTAVEAPEQTWLTRTDDAPARSPEARPTRPDDAPAPRSTRPDDAPARSPEARPPRPDDGPTPRPASDPRSSPGSASRSDEINGGDDQPWIALPIEPDDPTEPPVR